MWLIHLENVVEIAKVMNLLMNNPIPKNLRLFLVTTDGAYVYANNGKPQMGHKFAGFFDFQAVNRGQILDSFAKVEFLINEMMRFDLVGFDIEKSDKFILLNSKLSVSAKLSVLRKWKIIDKELEDKWKTLFEQVRNSLAHKFSEYEVLYKDQPLTNTDVLNQFKEDCNDGWGRLLDIYQKQLWNIDYDLLVKIIDDYKETLVKK